MAEIVVKLVNGDLAGRSGQELAKNFRAATVEVNKATIGTQDWIKANEKLADAKALHEGYRKQLESTTKASNSLKQSFLGILNQIPGFSQISGALTSAQSGVGGLTTGFGLLRGAIAATGIGLLVLAVGSLIVAFTKFTPLMDKVEQVFGGLGQILDVIINRIINLGKGLVDIATGNWRAGVDKISASFKNLGSAMSAAYDAGVALKKMQQDLEDGARGVDIANAKAEASVNRLIVAAKNKLLSDKQQNDILLKARKIAEENFAANDAQKQKEFDLLIREAQLKSKLSKEEILQLTEGTLAYEIEYEKRGTISDDLLDKIKEAQIERINAEGQTGKLLEKINNASDANDKERNAKKEKALAEQLRKEEEAARKRKQLLDEEEKARKDFYDEETIIRELHNQAQADSRQKDLDEVTLSLQKQIEALDINSPLYAEHLSAAQELARKQRDDVNAKWDKIETDRAKEAADKQKKITDEKTKFETSMADVRFQSEKAAVDGAADLIAQSIKDEKAAKVVKKSFALVDIGLNLAKELSANALAAAANPLNALTFGAAGATQLVTSNTRSIINAGLNTARVLLFRKGGFTGSTSSDDEVRGVVHGNEYVVPAPIVRNPSYRGILATLESARLRGYKSGGVVGPTNPFRNDFSRGPIASGSTSSNSSSVELSAEVINQLGAVLAEHTRNEIHKIKVINNLQETQNGLMALNQLQSDADL